MNMKLALIKNQKIEQIIVADTIESVSSIFADYLIINVTDMDCGPGDSYVDGEIVKESSPVNIIPNEITMRQARLILLENNLLSSVSQAITSLPEPNKTKAQIEWEYSNTLQRNNYFVSVLSSALGLSDTAVDNLFIEGAKL